MGLGQIAGGGSSSVIRPSCGRLSPTSGVPFETSDVTGVTAIRLEPWDGSELSLLTSSDVPISATFSGTALNLGTLVSGKHYDVFGYYSNGTVALELGTAWTNDTTRAQAVALVSGWVVKSADHTRRLLGTFRTDSTTTTKWTADCRYIGSLLGAKPTVVVKEETTATWPYTAAAWRVSNGSSTNSASWVQPYVTGFVAYGASITSSATTDILRWGGAALNTTATAGAYRAINGVASSTVDPFKSGVPQAGLNTVYPMEFGAAGVTFLGLNAGHRAWATPEI